MIETAWEGLFLQFCFTVYSVKNVLYQKAGTDIKGLQCFDLLIIKT